ncbi:MAG: MmcQ/YjbR family DNA-binding protein [Anaerolineae bacterium]|nr:MmcQ/YjbR family DNA-binding protein [Anaerolineae bacterium]
MSANSLQRVRDLCLTLPETTEKISHGEPTFFVGKKVFVMFADNHHQDGRVAVWLPVPLGMQETLIASDADTFFKPPYVGPRGWVGIVLDRISDDDLAYYVRAAWSLIAPPKLRRAEHPPDP